MLYCCLFIFLAIFSKWTAIFFPSWSNCPISVLNCVSKNINIGTSQYFSVCSLVLMGCTFQAIERIKTSIKQWKPNRFERSNVLLIWIEYECFKKQANKQTNKYTCIIKSRLFNPLFQCWHHTMPQGWFGLTSISLFSRIHVASRIKKRLPEIAQRKNVF